ncbi:DUF3265 domain-containing protein [Vibrio parahaemolyticus]|nr:DUF3265 domain-containing protein [Vibrio parahaemolyticus]
MARSIFCAISGTYITNNLRVIRHAWHFYYALVSVVSVVKAVCGSISIACLTP